MAYVELQTLTAFSFQEGASLPEEIAHRAAEIGHAAVAIADRNTLSGVVRAHIAAIGVTRFIKRAIAFKPKI